MAIKKIKKSGQMAFMKKLVIKLFHDKGNTHPFSELTWDWAAWLLIDKFINV